MNDSKEFEDAESVRSGNSHVTSQPMLFPKYPPFEGMLRPSFVSPRRRDGPPNIWDTSSGFSGNVVANPQVCTCSQFPTEAMQWVKEVELVDSVDELVSSSSTRGISMPNFEVLDARIAQGH